MSISFACPQCWAQVEVGDEFAGHAGQCPRCQSVIAIPSATQPAPVPSKKETPPPPPREAKSKPKPRPRMAEEPRRRRPPPEPAKPFGPIWPWLVGGLAAIVFVGLMVSSVAVLAFWRQPVVTPKRDDPPAGLNALQMNAPVATIGRLEGKKAILQGGVFQARARFTDADFINFVDGQVGARGRSRDFEIDMRANKDYTLEYESPHFDCYLNIDNIGRNFEWPPLAKAGARGNRVARMNFRPPIDGAYRITVSSFDPAVGEYTLTIREREMPRPFVPPPPK